MTHTQSQNIPLTDGTLNQMDQVRHMLWEINIQCLLILVQGIRMYCMPSGWKHLQVRNIKFNTLN